MRSVVVFIVVVMWGVYLGMWLQSRRDRRSMSSITTFNKHLAVLGRTAPAAADLSAAAGPGAVPRSVPAAPAAPVPVPLPVQAPVRVGMTLEDARNRRRQVLTTLTATASVTAGMAFFGGRPMLVLHLLVDALLVTYVGLLVRTQRGAIERRAKVVYLPHGGYPTTVRAVPEAVLLQRPAN